MSPHKNQWSLLKVDGQQRLAFNTQMKLPSWLVMSWSKSKFLQGEVVKVYEKHLQV